MEYKSPSGHTFDFSGWQPDWLPSRLFDEGNYLDCLHGMAFSVWFLARLGLRDSVNDLSDEGILHELIHLACGVENCTENTIQSLRETVVQIEQQVLISLE